MAFLPCVGFCVGFLHPGNMTEKKKKPQNRCGSRAFLGAARQIRTADLILTKDVLCLLSHSSVNGDPERARTVDL